MKILLIASLFAVDPCVSVPTTISVSNHNNIVKVEMLRTELQNHVNRMKENNCDMSSIWIEDIKIQKTGMATNYEPSTRLLYRAGISPCGNLGMCNGNQWTTFKGVKYTYRIHSQNHPVGTSAGNVDTEIQSVITNIMKMEDKVREFKNGQLVKFK